MGLLVFAQALPSDWALSTRGHGPRSTSCCISADPVIFPGVPSHEGWGHWLWSMQASGTRSCLHGLAPRQLRGAPSWEGHVGPTLVCLQKLPDVTWPRTVRGALLSWLLPCQPRSSSPAHRRGPGLTHLPLSPPTSPCPTVLCTTAMNLNCLECSRRLSTPASNPSVRPPTPTGPGHLCVSSCGILWLRGPSHPQQGARPTRVAAWFSSPSLLLGLRQKHYTDAPWSQHNRLFFSERSNCDFSPSFSKYTPKFQESFRFTESLQRERGGSPHAPRLPSHTMVVHLSQRRSVHGNRASLPSSCPLSAPGPT